KLAGVAGRFVRLALSGRSYLHLDEVEVYPAGGEANVALGRPANQSSTSQWSKPHGKSAPGVLAAYPYGRVIQRGLRLAESQRRLGAKVEHEVQALHEIESQVAKLPSDASDDTRRELYFRAHWAVRRMALNNPLLN